jgi:hypothetical protein
MIISSTSTRATETRRFHVNTRDEIRRGVKRLGMLREHIKATE